MRASSRCPLLANPEERLLEWHNDSNNVIYESR